jgi:hypothetical protein
VVFLETLDDLVERGSRRDGAHLAALELGDRAPARRAHESHERYDAAQLPVVVDQGDLVELREQVFVHLLQHRQGFPDGPSGSRLEEVGRHQAARAVLAKGEQLTHLVGVFVLHRVEHRLEALFGEISEDVRRFVRRHLLEQVGGPVYVHRLDHGRLHRRLGLG